MREEAELSISELRQKRGESNKQSSQSVDEGHHDHERNGSDPEEIWAQPRPATNAVGPRRQQPYADSADDEDSFNLPFDPTRLLEALKRKWHWWLGAGAIVLFLGILWAILATRSMASVQLLRREAPTLFRANETADGFKPQQFSEQTLLALIKNPEVLSRVSLKASPPINSSELSESLIITPHPETDLVTLTIKRSSTPQDTVNLMNLYATELVSFTQEMQAREARSIVSYVGDKLKNIEAELATVDAEMRKLPPEAKVSTSDKLTEAYLIQLSELEVKYELARMDLEHNNPVADQLQVARSELAGLLVRYTDAHPLVQDQRLKIKTLETEIAATGTNVVRFGAANAGRSTEALLAQTQTVEKQAEQLRVLRDRVREKLAGMSENSLEYALIKSRFQTLETIRSTLASAQREAQMFVESALGYFSIFTPASINRVSTKGHLKKALLISMVGSMFSMFFVAGLVVFREVIDDRLKTPADVTRVTGLPLMGTLGDLKQMDTAAQNAWAFRTWTILKGKLSESQTKGMVCGFMAARHGEGCTTWVNLLTKTANQRGLRVLTVATKPSEAPPVHPHESNEENPEPETTMLSPTAFSFPAQVTQQLRDPNAHSIVHIPLPGWVWNLERREQWQTALDHWRKIDNLVLLVELPPASEPESILLAEKVPQLIWLTDSGKATVHETRTHIETLRHAGCNLVGAVLNREPASFWNRHIVRRFGLGLLFLSLGFTPVQANDLVDSQLREIEARVAAAKRLAASNEIETKKSIVVENSVPPQVVSETNFVVKTKAVIPSPKAADNSATFAVTENGAFTNTIFPGRNIVEPKDLFLPARKLIPTTEYAEEEEGDITPAAIPSFSVISPKQRANWQKRLTLGPGDILTLGFYGETNLTKENVTVRPDGRISYLQAHDIMATGLTVDELRDKFNEELTKYFRSPRVLISPVSFHSKKYYVLGKVMLKGAFTLDRPMTLIEAVARAQGLETGILNRNSVDLADMERSFLIREGQRVPIDFEKLFEQGDLSQNIPIEPNDFIYFPPISLKEVYVLGEVLTPGVVSFTADTSVLAAIADRGGFSRRAFKSRVLIVRGSLNNPQTFVANGPAMVDARHPDFKLQPKDIIYVSSRPFIKAEELLDVAATSFIQSAVTSWVGGFIGPIITSPFVPHP